MYYLVYQIFFTLAALTLVIKKHRLSLKKIVPPLEVLIKSIISVDYLSADIGKRYLESMYNENENKTLKEKKAKYIKKRNYINLLISIIVFVIVSRKTITLSTAILLMVIYRIISRSFEIIFAFGKDVAGKKKYEVIEKVEKITVVESDGSKSEKTLIKEKTVVKKGSNLNSYERMKLAIISYVEVNLNFAALYYLINLEGARTLYSKAFSTFLKGDLLGKDPHTTKQLTLGIWQSLYKCIGISTASGIGSGELGPFSALHSITAMVLVVFAIATYLSSDEGSS